MLSFLRRLLPTRRAKAGAATRTPVVGASEVDPARVGVLTLSYAPRADHAPDAGEVVWAWVPYAEADGRGKDRPVLVIARGPAGRVYAVKLTSRAHDGERDFLPIGTGAWDPQRRPSWVDLDQLYLLPETGMRREGAGLDRAAYDRVARTLSARYGWRVAS